MSDRQWWKLSRPLDRRFLSFRFLSFCIVLAIVFSTALGVYTYRQHKQARPHQKVAELGSSLAKLKFFWDDRGRNYLSLNLSKSKVTDEDVSDLMWLPLVHSLDLSDTAITNAGLAYLRTRTDLRELVLDRTRISDGGLLHLRRMRHLDRLTLRGTRITDEGIPHLTRLKVNIWFISLNNTLVTREGVALLQRALPRTKIYWNDGYWNCPANIGHPPGRCTHMPRCSW